jgi:hypothetical protein
LTTEGSAKSKAGRKYTPVKCVFLTGISLTGVHPHSTKQNDSVQPYTKINFNSGRQKRSIPLCIHSKESKNAAHSTPPIYVHEIAEK